MGIPYRRHGPSAALQDFLEPLHPGGYFDCGRARLHGIDDALLDEARRRGRDVGDDAFQLVACEMGLIFCRPSIKFAISARWDEVTIVRPQGDDPVLMVVTWPKHGDLNFTVSKRLAGNVFRRWLQLQMQSTDRQRRHHPSEPFGVRVAVSSDPATGEPQGSVRPQPTASSAAAAPTRSRLATSASAPQESRSAVAVSGSHPAVAAAEGRPAVAVSGPRPVVAVSGARPAGSVLGGRPIMADGDLQRVVPPRSLGQTASTSWVGSPVSLVAALVVLSSAVLVTAVAVGLNRSGASSATSATEPGPPGVEATEPFSAIDHQRFNPTADSSAGIDGSASAADGDTAESERSADGSANEGQVTLEPTGTALDVSVAPIGQAGDQAQSDGGQGDSEQTGEHAISESSTTVPDDAPPPLVLTQPGGAEGALRCDSNYSGCVPPVAGLEAAPGVELDVDCDGRGNGPWMMVGEVLVLGDDIYGLDTDGDGLACEADQPDDRLVEDGEANPAEAEAEAATTSE
jgi:hypothetical protein